MGEALLWMAIGAAIGAFAAYRWAQTRRPAGTADDTVPSPKRAAAEVAAPVAEKPVGPATAPPPAAPAPPSALPAPPPPPPLPATFSGRVQALTPDVDNALEASAYPTDLLENASFQKVVALLRDPAVSLETGLQYALGANVGLSCAAFEAMSERTDAGPAAGRIANSFPSLGLWQLHCALRALRAATPGAPIGTALLRGQDWWPSRPVVFSIVGEHLRAARAQGGAVGFGDELARAAPADIRRAAKLLRGIDDPLARELLAVLDAWRERTIDRAALGEFGQFVDSRAPAEVLLELDAWAESMALSEATLVAQPPRSVVVVGEPRCGKSTLVQLLAEHLQHSGYTVFAAGGAEIMAGQKYVGELEERVQLLLRELAIVKRVVWYAPDLSQLAVAGVHRSQPSSILDQILPAIAAGQIVLISEATPAQLTRLLQYKPALRSILQLIRMPSLTPIEIEDATLAYAAKLGKVLRLEIAPGVAQTALHLARQYLGGQHAIGSGFDFIKLACTRALASDLHALTRDGLLDTLSQATGLPRAILDDGEKIELASLRMFFAQRVIGQAAAVEAIVDRIAMLKAGLTDPGRPIGVFLFAGPTGTGKTELAKTLAEYLFGAPDRMIRLDMSEFQSAESARKIVGEPGDGEAESLTQRVRKQPFCVVLLDEFEKAHPNAWDLFLQVFDDGRLTDANGHTVDFRHAIVVLTTNLGATVHKGGNLGFAPTSTAFNDAQVLRAVQQSFRPEFVNRIDRVIVFQPLGRERMHEILQKELKRVLERRGLKERDWAVEWESSALEFLLDKGFTPDMGARPLRRAIDQYLLAPLAATLVEHRFPKGEQFLFVRSDGQGIQVEFVDPDAEETPAAALAPAEAGDLAARSLGQVILRPSGRPEESAFLQTRLAAAWRTIDGAELETKRATLASEMRSAGFWERDDRFAVLARYALHDRVRAALDTAASLEERLKRSGRGGQHSKALAGRLAQQVYLIELGLADAREGNVSDAVLSVIPALEGGGDRIETDAWCARVHEMYRGWAARRHMQLVELTLEGRPVLVIGGFGAWRILSAEAGLHVLELEGASTSRRAARVVVAAEEPANPATRTRRGSSLATRLAAAAASNEVVRRYREGAAPLVRARGWRTGRVDLVLAGDFDLIAGGG